MTERPIRAVIVHGLAEAEAALRAAAAAGVAVTLLSAPGAGAYAGLGWWRALVAAARQAVPAAIAADVLDCAEAAGFAAEALRAGASVVFTGPPAQAEALAALAAACGVRLWRAAPPALDLGAPGAARRLARWLGEGGAG